LPVLRTKKRKRALFRLRGGVIIAGAGAAVGAVGCFATAQKGTVTTAIVAVAGLLILLDIALSKSDDINRCSRVQALAALMTRQLKLERYAPVAMACGCIILPSDSRDKNFFSALVAYRGQTCRQLCAIVGH